MRSENAQIKNTQVDGKHIYALTDGRQQGSGHYAKFGAQIKIKRVDLMIFPFLPSLSFEIEFDEILIVQ